MARTANDLPPSTLRLILAAGVGPRILARLRAQFGQDEAIVAASVRRLAATPRIGVRAATALHDAIRSADPDAERAAMSRVGARVVLLGDDDYPPLLAAIDDAPPALWVRGALRGHDLAALAVVGSRRCTAYGVDRAGTLAARLADHGLTIVSGGALGIDAAAHRGALRAGGRTVAVLGCGVGRSYPAAHARLFRDIVASGSAVVSELPTLAPPLAHHFPRRNRIISGLSVGVLVIEAARRSGALITARLAVEDHGREAMVLPGRADSTASIGGLAAARDGWAALVLDEQDVLAQLQSSGHLARGALELADQRRRRSGRDDDDVADALTRSERRLVEVMRRTNGEMPVDALAAAAGRDVSEILADLTLLELRTLVTVRGGSARLTDRGEGRTSRIAR